MKSSMLAMPGMLAVLIWSVSLAAGQEIQHLKFTYEEGGFYPCLAEDVLTIYHVSVRFRQADTPSGSRGTGAAGRLDL